MVWPLGLGWLEVRSNHIGVVIGTLGLCSALSEFLKVIPFGEIAEPWLHDIPRENPISICDLCD